MLSEEGVEFIQQYYPLPDVTWDDVIEKLDEDVLDLSLIHISEPTRPY